MIKVIVDAGPLIAYSNRRDACHEWAKTIASELSPPLYTCEPVLTEVFWRVEHDGGRPDLIWEWIDNRVLVVDFVASKYWTDLHRLMTRYADQPMDFADACLVKMSELVPDCRVWTIDGDFKVYRRRERLHIPLIFPGSQDSGIS